MSPATRSSSRFEARETRPSRSILFGIVLLLLVTAIPAQGGGVQVTLLLPVRARIDLTDRSTVTVAPFLVVRDEGEETAARRGVDVEDEFERYMSRLIRRETRLKLIESGPVDYPSYDLRELSADTDFWRYLGERTQADLIVSGSLDFDIQDRSGYRTEEYVSPYDGRTYYRQVLVEQTGFEYDIVMQVFDGATGEQLYSDNFKDFKQFEGERADPLQGMFENLYALEDRIANIFAQKQVAATRVLITP